jgi:tetratricopeptide (TPR) repeat protein
MPASRRWLRIAGLVLAALGFCVAVAAYRRHQERRIVALSVERAERLVRSGSWSGYREAATLLGLRAAALDPRAAALRAHALALIALDHRDAAAAREARSELARCGPDPTPAAALARTALALGDGDPAAALGHLAGASGAQAHLLAARASHLAGDVPAAREALRRALAADPHLPAALALNGDLLRAGRRPREARDAYVAAWKESLAVLDGAEGTPPLAARLPQARATFGLAKLALSRDVPASEAAAALAPLVDAGGDAPWTDRARAALYLAALQARRGDAAAARATLDRAGTTGPLRAWLDEAARRLAAAAGPYRVPDATPPELVSSSDDDPYLAPIPIAAVSRAAAPKPARRERSRQRDRAVASRPVHPSPR